MCRGCGKVKYVAPATRPESEPVVKSYRTEEEVLVVYSGSVVLRVVGCKSRHVYLFAPGVTRSIDKDDAGCLVDTEVFKYGG